MGGGGTMRTAAKLAGIGVARSRFRGSPASYPVEQPVRNASRPASSAGVSSQGARVAEVSPLHTAASGDLNEWESADIGDFVMSAGEPVPRVVFGELPTFQEMKKATADLTEAIDQIFFSQSEGSSPGSEVSVLSPAVVEPVTKSCPVEAISKHSVPNHAVQAFQLLRKSPEAQATVAEIASDPIMLKFVMDHPAVTDFLESQLTEGTARKVVESTNDAAIADSETVETPLKEEKLESQWGYYFDFMGTLQNVKLTVTEMVSRMTNFLQNIFPTTAEKDNSSADDDGASPMDNKNFMGRTFMGLAVMVIMFALMKRV